ncbi:MAG: DUF4372 domain-containing protein [Pseudomonadota bacterium]
MLHHFPRTEFAALVKLHGAEVRTKGFPCWTQFVAMLFCHLAKVDSLREICQGLSCCLGKLSHLGVSAAPKRSILSYANQHRTSALFRALFFKAMEHFLGHYPTLSRCPQDRGNFIAAYRSPSCFRP